MPPGSPILGSLPRRATTVMSIFGSNWTRPLAALGTLIKSVTFLIMLVQVSMFIVALVKSDGIVLPSLNTTFGPSRCDLIRNGAKYTPFIVHKNEYWRLVSAMFIHSGFLTLIITLVMEYFIILPTEAEHGHLTILLVFFACGLSGYCFSALASPFGVSTGSLPSVMGFVGFRLAHMFVDWQSYTQRGSGRTGILEGISVLVALIVGQSTFVDNFASFTGGLVGFFLGSSYIAHAMEDTDYCFKRSIMGLAGLTAAFVVFLCVITLVVGTQVPIIEQHMWGLVCRPTQSTFLDPFIFN